MRYAFLMSGHKPADDLHCVIDRFADRYRTFIQMVTKFFAPEQLGDDERRSFVCTKIIDRQNVWMAQRGCRHCLLLESLKPVDIICNSGGKDLDSNFTIQPRVFRRIHLSHSTLADLFDNGVMAHLLASDERR